MKKLGGTLFTHDALRQDYCLSQALMSLLDVCDQVVVLDAESTDGTYEYLLEVRKLFPDKLINVAQWNWEPEKGKEQLADLANEARSYLSTKWHFMLQADEVIHPDSYVEIRKAIDEGDELGIDSFMCTRINFWKDALHYIPEGSPHAPCGTSIIRLARTENKAIGDAESLQGGMRHGNMTRDRIKIMHYGMIRGGTQLVDKCIEMQSWFHGVGGAPDPRIVSMKERALPFQFSESIPDEVLVQYTGTHPWRVESWLRERGRL